ncbi:membrane cofactor protein-like isoform X2 [Scyliorhinus canicula]|uniref:membrane cofactor protein-like isoform X2 n=1 Tax=Scyliorhinus canicula TaxID=7830 RepID=UPI0018F38204|nr:membrane cofactor protein-like isoform X2 [Scyliorhinus canicula]
MLKDRENWGMSGRLILALTAAWVAQVTGNCGTPPALRNGSPTDQFIGLLSFPVGTRVTYSCYPGYQFVSGSRRYSTCDNRSVWTRLRSACEAISCGNPGELLNGYYDAPSATFGSRATFYCDIGFKLVGRQHRLCTATGWDGQVPTCDPVTCPHPPVINDGIASTSSADDWEYGMVVKYTCLGDKSLIGENELFCMATGHWDKKPPKCKAVRCPRPPSPENSFIVSGFGPEYKYKDAISYRCNKGLTVVGSNVIYCGENNIFEPSPPTCSDETSRHHGGTVKIENTYGLLITLLVIVLLAECDDWCIVYRDTTCSHTNTI